MKKLEWYERIMNEEFKTSSGPTPQWVTFAGEVKRWFRKFCDDHHYAGFEFNRGHFYFSGFFLVGNQWWYFLSSDVRFKISNSLMIRKCSGPNDYHGERNQDVSYERENFKDGILSIVVQQSHIFADATAQGE